MKLIKLLSISVAGLAVLSLASPAQPQAPRGPPCVDRAQLVAHLHAMFREQAVGSGLAQGGFVLELFVSQSGSWTVFATTPQGMSCHVATGEGWDPLPRPDAFAEH